MRLAIVPACRDFARLESIGRPHKDNDLILDGLKGCLGYGNCGRCGAEWNFGGHERAGPQPMGCVVDGGHDAGEARILVKQRTDEHDLGGDRFSFIAKLQSDGLSFADRVQVGGRNGKFSPDDFEIDDDEQFAFLSFSADERAEVNPVAPRCAPRLAPEALAAAASQPAVAEVLRSDPQSGRARIISAAPLRV